MTTPRAPAAASVERRRASSRSRVLDGLFLLTILTVTFHKLQWELAGSLTLSDILTSVFLVLFVVGSHRAQRRTLRRAPRRSRFAFFVAFALLYLAGFYSLDTGAGARAVGEGDGEVRPPLRVPRHGRRAAGAARACASTGTRSPRSSAASGWTRSTASSSSFSPRRASISTQLLIEPITSRQTGINVFGAVGGTQEVFRPNALTGDPNHLGIELVIPLLVLTPLYLRLEARPSAEDAARDLAGVPARRRARDALAQRAPRARVRCARARAPVPAPPPQAGVPRAARRGRRSSSRPSSSSGSTSSSRCFARGRIRAAAAASPHFAVYSFVPDILSYATRSSGSG